jgi:acyl transferase domain-containing protein/3-hydroxymyristoyl/3-hydroxydecanoyl-(acyl carrier protein) dehydratase
MTPIAIVGRACVLPGALSPEALWQAVVDGRDLTQSVASRELVGWAKAQPCPTLAPTMLGTLRLAQPTGPRNRWRLSPGHALCPPGAPVPDRCWSDRGGYVEGFDAIWDPRGFALSPEQLAGLDPLVHWVLHCAREAMSQARIRPPRIGAILGNLGFPSESMAAFADQVWTGRGKVDPRNRFMSGGTAAILAQALGLDAASLCLDAACASSLYAIKLACDQLNDGDADLMLAGAVQRADPLFLQMGFAALGALSRSGLSRPFHRDADGLLPAEGCAMLALKRLADARRDGDTVHAVIRGIGLSNDGRGKGLLVPDEAGQQRAMHAAYAEAGIAPGQVSLLECHATGTAVGDGAELRSSASVFAEARELPIGSLKSNLGHLITAAGAAGLIKLIEAMRHGVRPPNRAVDAPTAALSSTPFRLLQQAEPWPDDAPRIAAISAFGFGGNNAHLVVSADDSPESGQKRPDKSGPTEATAPRSAVVGPERAEPTKGTATRSAVVGPDLSGRSSSENPRRSDAIALVGLGISVGSAADRRQFTDALFSGSDFTSPSSAIELDLAGLRFPPRDLAQALPQQLAMLRVAREALAEVAPLPRERTAVLVGMEPDAEVARYGLRWRLAEAAGSPDWRQSAQDAVIAPLEAAGVLGCMPNIPANRLSSQFDFGGPAYTLQAGADSGLHALRNACRALALGEIDAALVGAVDLACEPVNRAAGNTDPVDAAVAWVLKRQVDAERDGDRVYAIVGADLSGRSCPKDGSTCEAESSRSDERIGNAGAAAGLLRASIAALCLNHRRHADGRPWLSAGTRGCALAVGGLPPLHLQEARAHRRRSEAPLPRLHVYAGADKAAVLAALQSAEPGGSGFSRDLLAPDATSHPARAVLIATEADFESVRQRALAHLRDGAPAGAAVHFRERPIGGEMAFAFAGAGASYPGMGRELLQQFPQLVDALAARSARLATALDWSFTHRPQPTALQQLWGASALSQLHLELTRGVLGLKADAWLGYSSGETNALVAAGVWNDPDALMDEMEASGLVTGLLGGEFSAVAAQWQCPVDWASWTVLAPLDEVRAALAGIERVHIAIINSDIDCLIAGDREGFARVVDRIGHGRCLELVYPLAVHVPELDAVAAQWLQLHRRETRAPRDGRIYSTAVGCAYQPDRESCAQAILDQANQTLDLRPVVLQAWADGVRVFIEHGPGGSFGRAIRSILGEREALVVSLDRKGQGLDGVLGAVAALVAAGVPVDVDALHAALQFVPATPPPQRPMSFPAHWPEIRLPAQVEVMAPAPRLPPVVPAGAAPSVVAPVGAGSARDPGRDVHVAPTGTAPPAVAPVGAGSARDPGRHAHVAPIGAALLVRQQLAALAQQQQGYLRVQAAAHQEFLALREKAQEVLLRHAGNGAPAALPQASSTPVGAPSGAKTSSPQTPAAIARERAPTESRPTATSFTRAQLEIHADGRISEIFGPAFASQDGFARQVRMPRPPLLLADRVTALDGAPGSMGKGRIRTETDVANHAWALHSGRLPAGVMIEAGQADLMLISWLGVDALNRGERVYRLLGCELTYHGDLPQAGDTLRFDIHLDGHAAQGDVRLMFFHYDCVNGERAQLSVRQGQAGFFTDAELAASAGCLWSPETQAIVDSPRLDPPAVAAVPRELSRAQLEALAAGDAAACFGPGFEYARTHTRSPSIHGGRMLLLDRVSAIATDGGPWRRGYLRAELDIAPDQWFFDGHFKNDPCMPGTLMFEGCLQALAVYLAAGGHTLKRDGWRFQPVPELPYQLQCRGQVTPASRLLVTEVFVEELIAGPIPTVYADLLCSVDGLKAFHARRVALQLVPDWPLEDEAFDVGWAKAQPCPTIPRKELGTLRLAQPTVPGAPPAVIDGFAFDRRSLLACALGRPSQAFGPMYARFDGPTRVARLPSPPYHFISRIAAIEGPIGVMRAGARVVAEYDVPDAAWYLDDNGARVMPFAVLLEAALQPCGWLSSYVGCALTSASELGFRNLDGEGTVMAELHAGCGTLVTEVELTDVSASAGMIIESFAVVCRLGEREVYRLRTVFGFFPPEALAAQVGLPVSGQQRELLGRDPGPGTRDPGSVPGATQVPAHSDPVAVAGAPDLLLRVPGPVSRVPTLPTRMLRMLDRIEGWWPQAGAAGLGQMRAAKGIDPGEWFFKAHFFQDPVQPGSLGLEAMLQTLQWYLLQQEGVDAMENPRFESIARDRPHRWKYRGQVLPQHRRVHTTLEVTERGRDGRGIYAIADASLWVDGQRIYEARGLGVRVVSGTD